MKFETMKAFLSWFLCSSSGFLLEVSLWNFYSYFYFLIFFGLILFFFVGLFFYILDACFRWFFDFLHKFPPQSRLPREIELSARCRDNISLRLLQQSGLAFFTNFLTSQPNYYHFYSVSDVEEERNPMFYLIRCLCKEITL